MDLLSDHSAQDQTADQRPLDVDAWTDSSDQSGQDLGDAIPDDLDAILSDSLDVDADAHDLWDIDADLCQPNCTDRICGPDGCGGICGLCPSSKPNCVLGKCKACQPACTAKECGSDGCGGVCGACPNGFSCQEGQCIPPACDQSVVVFWESFDSCSQGAFEVIDLQPEDSVSWMPVTTKTFAGTCALYLGDPAMGLYDSQARVTLSLLSPAFQIPTSPPTSVQFRLWAQAEPVPAPQYPYDYDVLYLYVRSTQGGSDTLVFSSKQLLNDTQNLFAPVAIDLQPFAGQNVRLLFQFDTLDSIDNAYAGFFLDELRVVSTCPYCLKDPQCQGQLSSACTAPVCVPFANNSAAGTCTQEPIDACCTLETEEYCDDADPCTIDSCDAESQTCAHLLSTAPEC